QPHREHQGASVVRGLQRFVLITNEGYGHPGSAPRSHTPDAFDPLHHIGPPRLRRLPSGQGEGPDTITVSGPSS
ncbi:MAG: hypothetical protein ACR2HA_08465, partial [Nocardioides sp.]